MHLDKYKGFKPERIDEEDIKKIQELAQRIRLNAAYMIDNAGSGHIGGACSSIDIYLMLWLCANISQQTVGDTGRDRIVISHGHTSAGIYSVLGNLGYFPVEDAIKGFRKNGSTFEGHPSVCVPGIEWCNGILGQGLSEGCGFALAAKIKELDYNVIVVMGDGEQAKGQIQEAREFAYKYKLNNLTAIIDYNRLQASGSIKDVMPQKISGKYRSAGWKVMETDGHDYQAIYMSLRQAYYEKTEPVVIIANTVMGKGFCGIEGNYLYHGNIMESKEIEKAEKELPNNPLNIDFEYKAVCIDEDKPMSVQVGYARTYTEKVDLRTAAGNAVLDIASLNHETPGVHIAALDCDLAASVKLKNFKDKYPAQFFECGIAEHNAVTMANALSKESVLTFLGAFGVFGIDETYSQQRIADMNHCNIKMLCTHCGLDVGEDGKTHQCVDYLSLLSNLHNMKVIIPADANQTDRVVRYAAATKGSMAILMGRSKMPVIADENGSNFFADDYEFKYGKADWLRKGTNGTIITYGNMVSRALEAADVLTKSGKNMGVLNISCPLELDTEQIRLAAQTGYIVVYEDHNVRNGLGGLVAAYLLEKGISCCFKRIGVFKYGCSAIPEFNYKQQGLDADSLVKFINHSI